MCKHSKLVLAVLCIALLMSSCNSTSTKIDSEVNESNINKVDINRDKNVLNTIDEQGIKDFLNKFMTSIKNVDSQAFKDLMDEDGVYSITYFIDERDPNVVVHVFKDQIRDDLVLVNSENKVGITLDSLFSGNDEYPIEDIPIHTSKDLSSESFNIDWHVYNESMVEEKLNDINRICQKINLTNNVYIPQVFVLMDNIFAFAKSSSVLEPYPEFTGEWVIFESIDGEYKLRAIMKFE